MLLIRNLCGIQNTNCRLTSTVRLSEVEQEARKLPSGAKIVDQLPPMILLVKIFIFHGNDLSLIDWIRDIKDRSSCRSCLNSRARVELLQLELQRNMLKN